MHLRRRAPIAVLLSAIAVSLTGCGSGVDHHNDETLTVYAAASLTGTFTELGRTFEKDHPGVRVTFSFGGSADLVTQIQQGAPADVFASADTENMEKLSADGL